MDITELKEGDKVISKKLHPCGGNVWEIVRTGADFKFKCEKCGRFVMIDREKAKKFAKSKI